MKKFLFLTTFCFAGALAMEAQTNSPAAISPANASVAQAQSSSYRSSNPTTLINSMVEYGWDVMPAFTGGRWGTSPAFASPCISSTDTGFVYLIGGYDGTFANTNLNTRFNTVTKTYKNMTPIPATQGQVTPLYVKGKIYVIGGYGATAFSPVTTNSIYDIATNSWIIGAPMPVATGDYAAGVYKDSLIYYVGGYNGSADINNVQIYDVYTNTWTVGTAKTGTAVAGCRMSITNNNIVFVGGYSQTLTAEVSDALLGTIDVTNPVNITWTTLPSYPGGTVGRLGAGVAFQQNGLVYFCGGDPDGQGISALNSVYGYNTGSNQWESGPNMPTGVSNISGLAGVVYNDSLFIVTMGGYDGTNVVSVNNWLNVGPAILPGVQTNTMICQGSSIQLNAFNGSSYAWTPKATLTDSTIANPVSSATATTTYTVTMSKGYGCPVTKMITLTVNTLPVVVANASAASICAGSMETLSGSGATTYTWTGSVTDNVAFTPANTDTYTVTGTDANNCVNTATVTVTVNTLPTVVANASAATICSGSTETLSGSGATTYTWTGSVTDNVAFTPANTDTYTVSGTDANNCVNTATVTVTVNTLPTVVANASAATICSGSTETLSGSGATTYTWTGSVTDNVAFTPANTNTYTVTGTDANNCVNTATVTVTVNTLPVVTLTLTQNAICDNDAAITLSGGAPATGTYTGTGVSGGNFDPAVAGVGAQVITYSYTDGNGCSASATDNMTVNNCSAGINAVNGKTNVVYPNPNAGQFTIQTTAGLAQVEITNGLGQVIANFRMTTTSEQVDISRFETGLYFVRIVTGDSATTHTIAVKK